MDSELEIIACPYCGSRDAVVVRHVADIVKCSGCGTVYLRTRYTEQAMYKLYQSYAHDSSHMRLPDSLGEARASGLRRVALVEEVSSFVSDTGGNWLDVGCGWGGLLDYARERGFTPYGIELTRNCLDYAAMQLQLPVSNSQLLESRVSDDTFQVVTMVHVLEHLPFPKKSLDRVFKILQSGGMYCGIVPNYNSLCSELLADRWDWLDPQYHYVHYTPATLKARLEEAGFVVERVYTATGDFGRETVASYLLQVVPSLINTTRAEELLPTIESDGRGEEIRFFARKP